jgi:SAM-dependent methyltransferase
MSLGALLPRRTKHKVRRRHGALALLDGLPPGRVLDAPCGEGALARDLAVRGHEVWACDLDPSAIQGREGIRFDVVDLNRPLPYPDDFFDAVVSLEGIEHLESPATCLGEFARILRPRGRLVLSTPNVNNVQSRWEYFLTGRLSGFKTLARRALEAPAGPVHWHITVPYLPTLGFLLTQAGLRIDTVDVTMIKSGQWVLLPLALPMWLVARRAAPGTFARALGSWRLLLGRSVILRAVKGDPATPRLGGL